MTMRIECFECAAAVEAETVDRLADDFLAHARENHEWPFPDHAIRNYAEATQRLTGPSERLAEIGTVTIAPVTEDLIDDWAAFFDHDAFVGKPEWASCYCLEPHVATPERADANEMSHWTENREAMVQRLRSGQSFGYLAKVDGRTAAWVNASKRSDYSLFRGATAGGPSDGEIVGVACFIIAPPYRRHGLAGALLDRVIADAPGRGAVAVEAYPSNETHEDAAGNFRGPRSMYEARGFEVVEERERHTIVRKPV